MTRPSLLTGSAPAIGLLLLSMACGKTPHGERTTMVLLGRSSSERIAEHPPLLRGALGDWFSRVQYTGRGSFEVALIGRGIDDTPVVFSVDYPRAFPAPVTRHRAAWFDSVSKSLDTVAGALSSNRGSAIVEGLFRAARRLPTGLRDSVVIILGSDLRQVTPGKWNFERVTPEPQAFLDWIEQNGLTPALRPSMTVIACGFHMDTPDGTSRMTAANYARIEQVWQETFGRWVQRFQLKESCTSHDLAGK